MTEFPLEIQKNLVDKVMEQRKVIAELKAEVDNKFQQAKADVEAMILGTKNISVANREQGTARRHPNDLDKST